MIFAICVGVVFGLCAVAPLCVSGVPEDVLVKG